MTGHAPASRRQFFKFLAASPLLPAGLSPDSLRRIFLDRDPERTLDSVFQGPALITAPEQALNVMDFEPVARKTIPPSHWAYLATGVDGDGTVLANREGFTRFALRPRRLRDVTTIDTATRVLGAAWNTPIFLSPTSSGKAFHPDGEVAVARAARAKGYHQVLSTVATCSVEEVTAVELDPDAAALLKMNANANQQRIDVVCADAFPYMRQAAMNAKRYGLIILDPYKLIANQEGYALGRQKYIDLNRLGMVLLEPGGILVTCSCSGMLSWDEFLQFVRTAAGSCGRRVQVFRKSGAGADHPFTADHPEGEYLKVLWCRVL